MNQASADRYKPWPDSDDAKNIAVPKYELFLVWPVFVQCQRNDERKPVNLKFDPQEPGFLDQWVEHITAESPWQKLHGAYPPQRGEDAVPAYSEFVYFHPFVRQFLYTTRDDIRHFKRLDDGKHDLEGAINRNLRVLEREDLESLRVVLERENDKGELQRCESTFAVKAAWMYLFDTQIAMVELRLEYQSSEWIRDDGTRECVDDLRLDHTMKLNDAIRRIFATYWSLDSTGDDARVTHSTGSCPFESGLHYHLNADQYGPAKIIRSCFGRFQSAKTNAAEYPGIHCHFIAANYAEADDADPHQAAAIHKHLDHVHEHREQYASEMWATLMHPIKPASLTGDKETKLRFEQILDERVPIFAYLAVKNPRRISPGDWVRLAMIDGDDDSQAYPYSPAFLTPEYLRDYFYDRHWNATGGKPGLDYHTTRWLVSGYGFVGVGDADDGFYTNPHGGLLAHFRHHYFALGMIAHFHRASLLRFKHALAEAAEELHKEDPDGDMRLFREKVVTLQKEFLRFRTRYWFAEISNQIQGRELFEMWKKHLNTVALFDDVAGDIAAADEILRQHQEDARNGWLARIALLGAVFAVFTPAFSLLQDGLKKSPVLGGVAIFLCLLALAIPILTISKLPERLKMSKWPSWMQKSWNGILAWRWLLSVIVLVICFASGVAIMKHVWDTKDEKSQKLMRDPDDDKEKS